MGNLLDFCWIFIRLAGVPLRKSGERFGGQKCPADFGGANFSAPWTTRKAFSTQI